MYLTAKLPVNTNQGLARVLDLYRPCLIQPTGSLHHPWISQTFDLGVRSDWTFFQTLTGTLIP